MNHCTYQTSLALKAAGLPQPTPAPGQMWYLPKLGSFPGGEIPAHCVIYVSEDKTFTPPASRVYFAAVGAYVFRSTDVGQSLSEDKFVENGVFAPTLDHLLPLIGNDAIIKFMKDETGQIFECNIDEGDGRERTLGYHETSASEAAAMAWLNLNESPGKTFVQPGDIAQE